MSGPRTSTPIQGQAPQDLDYHSRNSESDSSNGYDDVLGLHILFHNEAEYETQQLPIQHHIDDSPPTNDNIQLDQSKTSQPHGLPNANDSFLTIPNDLETSHDSDRILNTVDKNFIERIERFRTFLQTDSQIWREQFELFNENGQELSVHYPILTPLIQDLSCINQRLNYYIRDYQGRNKCH